MRRSSSEIMDREWIGVELNDCSPIIDRFDDLEDEQEYMKDFEEELNVLFTEEALELRMKYKDEFGFNFEDYNLEESPIDSFQETLDSI